MASKAGAFAVEFALVLLVFLGVVFGAMEVARAMYLINTLSTVTQRAASLAAQTDFSNQAAMDTVRQSAIFRASAGALLFGAPVSDAHVRIDYLALLRAPDGALTMTPIAPNALPACPIANRITCSANPNDASCIRFVRARVCDTANTAACDAVSYQPLLPLVSLPLNLPTAVSIVSAESLGQSSAAASCP
ncbi:MAG: TadE/TadG family type IV pilus assembly protein [Pseudomonadota bacterium]